MNNKNNNSIIQMRMDKETVTQAENILKKLGLNRTSAITMFYKKIIEECGIPFQLKLKNDKYINIK